MIKFRFINLINKYEIYLNKGHFFFFYINLIRFKFSKIIKIFLLKNILFIL